MFHKGAENGERQREKGENKKRKMEKRRLRGVGRSTAMLLACALLAGCGQGEGNPAGDLQELDPAILEASRETGGPDGQEGPGTGHNGGTQTGATPAGNGGTGNTGDVAGGDSQGYPKGDRIEEQSFEVDLRPLGKVTFASYEPDPSGNPLADVVFQMEREGQVLLQLPGTEEGNVAMELFHQVEAVSFLDYNNDGYDDIIVILSYYFGAGPQAATSHSRVRYYKGSAEGSFVNEKEASEAASGALAEITVETAKGFIGVKTEDTPAEWTGTRDLQTAVGSLEPWQQAYLDYLDGESRVESQKGYTLICLSDTEIPQLVEVGDSEANGCRIVAYGEGRVHVTQLDRLHFHYIPDSNLLCNSDGLMDYYYDNVYRLENGELKTVASGHYGKLDDGPMEFDQNGEPVYQYEWNGTRVDKEAYAQALAQVYDTTQAVDYDYGSLYTVDEVKRVIGDYRKEPGA